jgi:hypothetical protein
VLLAVDLRGRGLIGRRETGPVAAAAAAGEEAGVTYA